MECLILEATSTYRDEKVIMSSQHGFTKGKSYLDNLIALYKETTTWMDEGGPLDVVYFSFSKAVSTVSQYPHR